MEKEFKELSKAMLRLKNAIYQIVDEYRKYIDRIKSDEITYLNFPPLTVEEFEEKVIEYYMKRIKHYITLFEGLDDFFGLILENKDFGGVPQVNEHKIFLYKLWLGDIYDTKNIKNVQALILYIDSIQDEQKRIGENTFMEIYYKHY